jgi:hypothetical protein
MYKIYFILLLLFLHLNIKSSAQFDARDTLVLQTKISIHHTQISLYDILNEIEEKYGINFSYANNLVSLDSKRTIDFKEQTLECVLNEIFKRSTITYKVIGKRVVLIKEDTTDNLLTTTSSGGIDTNNFSKANKRKGNYKIRNRGSRSTKNRKFYSGKTNIHKGEISRGKPNSGFIFSKHTIKRTIDSTITWDSLLVLKSHSFIKHHGFPDINETDKFSLSINFMAGPSLRKLNSNNPEGNDIKDQRSQEKHLTGFNNEIMINYNITPKFSLGLGVGLLKMGEHGTLYYNDKDSGRRNICRDSIYYYDTYDYNNKYSYLTLPITVSYAYYFKSFFIQVKGGFIPSFLLTKGEKLVYCNYSYYFDYENSSSRKQKDMVPPAKIDYREFNLAYTLHADLGYRFEKISISAGFSYYRFLFSSYNNHCPLKEKRYLPAISIGARYYF